MLWKSMTSSQQNEWILKYIGFIVPFIQLNLFLEIDIQFQFRFHHQFIWILKYLIYISYFSSVAIATERHPFRFHPFVCYLHLCSIFSSFPIILKAWRLWSNEIWNGILFWGRNFFLSSFCWSSLFIGFTHSDMKYGCRINEEYLKCYTIKYLCQVFTSY